MATVMYGREVFIWYSFHVYVVCVSLLQCMINANSCIKTLYEDRVNNVEDCESCDCHVTVSATYLEKWKNVIEIRSTLGHVARSIERYDIVFNMGYGCAHLL